MAGISHGRGGAGNECSMTLTHLCKRSLTYLSLVASIGNIYSNQTAKEAAKEASDLKTPHIKQDIFTTGRGGSGNMMVNDSKEITREAQDVEMPPQRTDQAPHHVGRGKGK